MRMCFITPERRGRFPIARQNGACEATANALGIARARRGGCGVIRGRLGAAAHARRCRFPACRLSSTGCASSISPTSISGSRRGASTPSTGRFAGRRRGSRISTAITGDLLSRPSAEPRLRMLLNRLPGSFAVLGNHDFAISRDPFSKPSAVSDLGSTTVLVDEARTVELRGRRVQIVGVDPRSYRSGDGASGAAGRPGRGSPDPALPLPERDRQAAGRRLRPRARRPSARAARSASRTGAERSGSRICAGPTRRGSTVARAAFCTSRPGLGTTFVPFRFFARPEATELVLESWP